MTGRLLSGPEPDPAGDAGHTDAPPRVGFFTDTTVCIGCKACEVACKEWNAIPEDGLSLTGMSYDNTEGLGASTWRHVAFIEQPAAPPSEVPVPDGRTELPLAADQRAGTPSAVAGSHGQGGDLRWLMSSDVCKHCTHAACLDAVSYTHL